MKITAIKSLKQLPAWFKLENYSKAKVFNAGEWYDELMPRFFMRQGKEKFENDSSDSFQRWGFIKRDGLLFYSSRRQKISHRVLSICPQVQLTRETNAASLRRDHEFTSMRSLENLYVYASYWLLEPSEREKVVQNITELFKDDGSGELAQEIKGEAATWAGKPFEDFPSDVQMGLKDKFAYARIELGASDEQIKQDFAAWLSYERTRRDCPAPKKNFSDVELNSWYEASVLPYLDLMFWALIEQVKINQYVIAQAIFSDAYSVDSVVDPLGKLKTTKKKADYLMNYQVMKLLELQINE